MIEFKWHNLTDDCWTLYDRTRHNAVKASNPNYYIRIDGTVYESYTQDILDDAIEKELTWRKLIGSNSSVQK